MSVDFLILLAWLPPLLAFVLLTCGEKMLSNRLIVGGVSITTTTSFVASALLGVQVFVGEKTYYVSVEWLNWGSKIFYITFQVDKWGSMMLLLVILIAGLVQLFSFTYMKDDRHFARYFAYLGLFSFAMLGLVLTDNLLVMYVFWELVGVSSYLLIGFWRQKPQAGLAAQKAFLLNRIGDIGFLIAIITLYALFQTLNIKEIAYLVEKTPATDSFWFYAVGLGLMTAGFGKSAQFLLASWLPDAMEGPTPVSALLHAATMVAAGVYLLARTHFLLLPDVALIIALLGGLTALIASFTALSQTDVKKVLAFSTISQIGYMMIAIGTHAPDLAMFHLLTHAFFKACLFLCAGSAIHYLHRHLPHDVDAQDMRNMGGLRDKLPVTFCAYTVSMLALSGVPLFSGFLSKDAILTFVVGFAIHHALYQVVVFFAFAAALLTPIYMMRQYYWVFLREATFDFHQEKEPIPFILPLVVLGLASVAFWFSPNPFNPEESWFLDGAALRHSAFVPIFSALIAFVGLGLAFYRLRTSQQDFLKEGSLAHRLSFHFFYLDNLYSFVLKQAALVMSALLSRVDRRLDQNIDFLARLTVVIGFLSAWLDRVVVDGFVKVGYKTVSFLGNEIMLIQKNSVQALLKWTVAALIGAFLLIVSLS